VHYYQDITAVLLRCQQMFAVVPVHRWVRCNA